jgi:hypothetical protein
VRYDRVKAKSLIGALPLDRFCKTLPSENELATPFTSARQEVALGTEPPGGQPVATAPDATNVQARRGVAGAVGLVAIPIVSAAVVCEQEQSSGIPMARCWITPQPVTPT